MTLLLKTRTKSAVKHSIKNLFRLISLIFLQPFVRDCKKKLIINFFGVLSAVTSWSSLKWHLKIVTGKGLTISIIDLLYLMAQEWSVSNSTKITVALNYFSSVTMSLDIAVVDVVLKLVSAIFYQIFIFSSNDRSSKTMKLKKLLFISSKKLFSISRYSFFVISSLPFHFPDQKGKWKWNNLWCHKLACINLQM